MTEPESPGGAGLGAAPTSQGLADRIRAISRPVKTLVVLGTVLLVLALTGLLQADRDLDITTEQAVEIARPEIDFEPGQTTVRLVRQGAGLNPVWAVSFSIADESESGFDRLTVVRVDGRTGEILEVAPQE